MREKDLPLEFEQALTSYREAWIQTVAKVGDFRLEDLDRIESKRLINLKLDLDDVRTLKDEVRPINDHLSGAFGFPVRMKTAVFFLNSISVDVSLKNQPVDDKKFYRELVFMDIEEAMTCLNPFSGPKISIPADIVQCLGDFLNKIDDGWYFGGDPLSVKISRFSVPSPM